MRTRIALAISMFTVAVAALLTIPTASSGAPASPRHRTLVTAAVAQPQQHLAPQILLSAGPTTTTSTTTTTAPPPVVTTTTVPPAPVVVTPAPPVGDNQSIWDCIISHESGGNPAAVNPSSGAGGLFQFLPSSWLAYGGGQFAALPEQATVAQQWQIAIAAQAQSGWYPWVGDGCTPVG